MSRCFPFPPPGYGAKDEALIQSIKLQKELEKAKKDRKREKKREKKESKKLKETQASTSSNGVVHGGCAQKVDRSYSKLDGKATYKRKLEEVEQLERSDITEEHGQPHSLQNPSYSSDSTQHSDRKRKLVPSVNAPSVNVPSINVDNSRGHGNILRIRLPLQKHKEPALTASKELVSLPSGSKVQVKEAHTSACKEQVSSFPSGRKGLLRKESGISAKKEQICSTSGSKDPLSNQGHGVGRIPSQDETCSLLEGKNVKRPSVGPSKELSCSTSGRTEALALEDQITSGLNSCKPQDTEVQKIDSYTKYLIQSLVPPALPSEVSNIDDDEWFFKRKHSDGNEAKKFKASGDFSCSGSSSWRPCAQYLGRPCAQYLAEAEIYALPYTVPF